jgi:hypothetical protein
MNPFQKPFIFIAGAPRSGTSMLTKMIDAHPDIAILMENILGNRRRHWQRAKFWNSARRLSREVKKAYARIPEPIIGDKVAMPDVWEAEDIARVCRLFNVFHILYIVRDPAAVALSRLRREPEDFDRVYSKEARQNILIDFRSRFQAYISSWRQSVEGYWRLRDGFRERVRLIYYEDLCRDVEGHLREIFVFLGVPFDPIVMRWHEMPHHNAEGRPARDLKYPDGPVAVRTGGAEIPPELQSALAPVSWQYALWQRRQL